MNYPNNPQGFDPQGYGQGHDPVQGGPGGPKKLIRNEQDKWVAGVCSGVANYFDIDPNIVRILVVVASLASVGTGVVLYAILWAVMPTS